VTQQLEMQSVPRAHAEQPILGPGVHQVVTDELVLTFGAGFELRASCRLCGGSWLMPRTPESARHLREILWAHSLAETAIDEGKEVEP
jgi:hypothetical protein